MEEKIKILLCEDDENLGMLLREYLQAKGFTTVLCPDGEVGYKEFNKNKFDIAVLDVMMPKKDGFTLAQEIRQTNADLPIIFLTAKTLKEDILEGFKIGADDYITKPFSTPYLLGRIEAILTQRRNIQMDVIRKLKETGDKDAIAALRIQPAAAPLPALNQAETSAENEAVNPNSELAFMAAQIQDRTMMRIFRFVVENAGNPELKIDDISNEIGMSRSVLYNKVKATTGMTPVDFVRHIRIKKACEILRNTDDTLTSIAFAVGFTDPKYFSKVFKKETGIVPTEYRNRTQG